MKTTDQFKGHQKLLFRFLRKYFDWLYHSLAWSYDFVAAAVSFGQWTKWVVSVQELLPGPEILELGLGTGHLQVELNRKAKVVFGLEASPQIARIALKRLCRSGMPLRLVLGRAQELPFPANSFDQIAATFPSEYIFDPQTLLEIHRALKPDGYAVILIQAELKEKSLPHRLLAWLYQFTGETRNWDDLWESWVVQPFTNAGLKVKTKELEVNNNLLRVIIAEKIKNLR